MDAELLVGGTFVALGWVAGLAVPAVAAFRCRGGSAHARARRALHRRALSYHRRWPNPSPSVFGYHEVFHVYVCAAAACQHTAIAPFIT
jgi:hemolysin III